MDGNFEFIIRKLSLLRARNWRNQAILQNQGIKYKRGGITPQKPRNTVSESHHANPYRGSLYPAYIHIEPSWLKELEIFPRKPRLFSI